jgi:hypothetical protein
MSWLRSLLGHSSQGAASPGSTGEAGPVADHRYYPRLKSGNMRFRLSWQDKRGKTKRRSAKVVDMNGTGALVECGMEIAPGSFVYIQTPDLGMMGSAYVRRCEAQLFSYQIGLQFAAPLTHRF